MSNQDIITTIQDLLKLNGSALPATVALTPKDSRLIAAAPELLEACKEIADHLYEKQDYSRCRELAGAAIAKAEGK